MSGRLSCLIGLVVSTFCHLDDGCGGNEGGRARRSPCAQLSTPRRHPLPPPCPLFQRTPQSSVTKSPGWFSPHVSMLHLDHDPPQVRVVGVEGWSVSWGGGVGGGTFGLVPFSSFFSLLLRSCPVPKHPPSLPSAVSFIEHGTSLYLNKISERPWQPSRLAQSDRTPATYSPPPWVLVLIYVSPLSPRPIIIQSAWTYIHTSIHIISPSVYTHHHLLVNGPCAQRQQESFLY